jgi:hypothetical protein
MRNILPLFEVREVLVLNFFHVRTTVWEKTLSFNKPEVVFLKYAYTLA